MGMPGQTENIYQFMYRVLLLLLLMLLLGYGPVCSKARGNIWQKPLTFAHFGMKQQQRITLGWIWYVCLCVCLSV